MRAVLITVLLAFALPVAAQEATPYWIFFSDKPAAEAVPLTERALERRALRGGTDLGRMDVPVSPAYLADLAARGIAVRTTSRWLNAASALLTAGQVDELSAVPFVRGLRAVARFAPLSVAEEAAPVGPLVPRAELPDYGASATQLRTINAIAALERGFNGTGVVLGFLDTEYGGFAHPAFARLVNEGRLLATRLFTPAAQSNRHGQNVASIAVGYVEGSLIGPAWGASVLAATTEFAPTETNAEEDAFVAGLEWLESQGVDVVNTSLGYTTFDAGQRSYTPADLDGDTGVTTRAADVAAALGVVVVTSAGNEGCSNPTACWYYIGTPADGDSVIAVGAINPDSSKAGFSSFGPTADGRIKPDVSAQGTSVRYATGAASYASGSGTSFSSPLVAGVAAQMLQANPALTPIQVRDILRRTASQAQSPDNRLGWGIVNADRAVQEATALSTIPTMPSTLWATVGPSPGRDEQTFFLGGPAVRATLEVFDATGRRVATPFAGTLGGPTRVAFHADLPAGLYLYRLTAGTAQVSGTFVRLR